MSHPHLDHLSSNSFRTLVSNWGKRLELSALVLHVFIFVMYDRNSLSFPEVGLLLCGIIIASFSYIDIILRSQVRIFSPVHNIAIQPKTN
jgi:hypothetical protein